VTLAHELVERFQPVRALGRGAHAQVYVARERAARRLIALKVLDLSFVAHLKASGRLLDAREVAAADLPGVVPVSAVDCTPDGGAYVATELLEGASLAARLGRGPVPCADAVLFCLHVGLALCEARDRGVVHGGVKPSNVFVVPDPTLPRGERALLADFGTASTGDEPCAPSTDVHGLGSLLHQLITGEPYGGERVPELLARGLHAAVALLIARTAGGFAIEDTVAELTEVAACGLDADPTDTKLPLRAPPRARSRRPAELTVAFTRVDAAEL
jgi:serine/threonine protein kinase